MADLGKGIRTYLLNQTSITDLVSTRIYPSTFPEGVIFPAVRYTIVSQFRQQLVGGASGMVESSVQFDVYASTHISANQIAEALREVLQGFSGSMGSEYVWSVQMSTGREMYEAAADASDEGLYRVIMDFAVMFEESVPTF